MPCDLWRNRALFDWNFFRPVPDSFSHHESKRIAALLEYHIVDTATEDAYDELALLAAEICEKPIGIISLVDEARQWFKARVGITLEQTPREIALCAHAILETEPLVVPDALQDARFASNPLVTNEPSIRFYAGFPLVSPEGYVLGTLCVMDHKPGMLSSRQHAFMQTLGRQVMALLELRRASAKLSEALETLRTPHGILALCSWCKSVRDSSGRWVAVETYLSRNSETQVTVGICPDCAIRKNPKWT
jgi:GAF domain-containing protein